jgi:hypothetical protein
MSWIFKPSDTSLIARSRTPLVIESRRRCSPENPHFDPLAGHHECGTLVGIMHSTLEPIGTRPCA